MASAVRRKKLIKVLTVLSIAGVLLSVVGALTIWYSGAHGVVDNTNPTANSIDMGWAPNNGVPPVDLVISMAPLINGTSTSEMLVFFYHGSHPNYTVTEGLLLPFYITKMRNLSGDWSYANAGDNGSIIKAVLPATSNENPVEVYVEFTHLLYSSSHGLYQLYFPMQSRVNNFQLYSALSKLNMSNFGFYGDVPTIFQIYISDRYQITNSYPAFKVESPEVGFKSDTPLQEVYYDLQANNTGPVVLSYNDPNEVIGYQTYQNFGFLLIGLGVPTTISSSFELFKERTR